MKKGSHQTKEAKLKLSLALKKYFKNNSAWNKGLKYGKYDEPTSLRFRRNKKYYIKELETNAKRSKSKNYYLDEERIEQITKLKNEYNKKTGSGRPKRDWSKEEIKYLKENYNKKTALEIALHLERSWSSIMHKVVRLKLQKYNKWN